MKRTEERKELRKSNAEAITKTIAENQEELMKLRFRHASGQLEHTARVGQLRKSIARAKTILKDAR